MRNLLKPFAAKATGWLMKRLKILILLFFVAISIPLAFVLWRTYTGLEQEERSQLAFFSETLFDQIEAELSALVREEENRAVDEYQYFLAHSPDYQQAPQQAIPSLRNGLPGLYPWLSAEQSGRLLSNPDNRG